MSLEIYLSLSGSINQIARRFSCCVKLKAYHGGGDKINWNGFEF